MTRARGDHMCSGVLREWTRRAEGLRHAMQECMGCKRHAQGGSTSARLCHAQHRVEAKGCAPGIIVVVGLVPTTRRRCRSERGVDHAARRLNELDVEKVQPAAFTCRQRAALEGRAAAPSCTGTALPARAKSEPVCFACFFLPLTAPPPERLCASMPP